MHSSRSLDHRRPAMAVLLAAPALALALVACSPPASSAGGSSPAASPAPASPPPASSAGGSSPAGSSAGGSGAASGADRDAARDAYDLKLAQCIRSRGVDVADPKPGEGFNETGPGVQAAASACAAELPPPPLLTPAEEEQVRGIYLKTAACLRERGYDVADPAPDQAIAITNDVPQSDVEACESAK